MGKIVAFYPANWWTIPEDQSNDGRHTLISGILYADPHAKFYVHDFYQGYRGETNRHRLLKDPYRAQKEIHVRFSDSKAEEWAICYLDSKQHTIDLGYLEHGNIHNQASARRLKQAIAQFYGSAAQPSKPDQIIPEKTEAAQPTSPIKPAIGNLLPQMPLPPHLRKRDEPVS